MNFTEELADFSAADIMAATGCPAGTAYDWKDGRRAPPQWQQPHWLRIIRSAATIKQKKGSPRPGSK